MAGFLKSTLGQIVGVFILVLFGVVVTQTVMAAIPDSNGTITACRTTATGTVRIIDTASESCSGSTETTIAWQQKDFVANLAGSDFKGADVRYRDFSGKNLTGADFSDVVMHGADFRNTNLTSTRISGVGHHANFSGVDFTVAIQEGLALTVSDLSNVDMSGMGWGQDDFRGSDLSNADLSDATFANTLFNRHVDAEVNTNLTGTDFTNTDFTNVDFLGTDLSVATLTGTTWTFVLCPDGVESQDNGNSCSGHLTP